MYTSENVIGNKCYNLSADKNYKPFVLNWENRMQKQNYDNNTGTPDYH